MALSIVRILFNPLFSLRCAVFVFVLPMTFDIPLYAPQSKTAFSVIPAAMAAVGSTDT
jgi:hypothetical protein